MIGRLVTDNVDHRDARTVGIVEIGESVGQSRAAMKQGRRGSSRDPGVAVGSTGGHALEKNMEAGVLIKGGAIPSALHRHLEALVTTKVIAGV